MRPLVQNTTDGTTRNAAADVRAEPLGEVVPERPVHHHLAGEREQGAGGGRGLDAVGEQDVAERRDDPHRDGGAAALAVEVQRDVDDRVLVEEQQDRARSDVDEVVPHLGGDDVAGELERREVGDPAVQRVGHDHDGERRAEVHRERGEDELGLDAPEVSGARDDPQQAERHDGRYGDEVDEGHRVTLTCRGGPERDPKTGRGGRMKVMVTGAGALLGQGVIRSLLASPLRPEVVALDPSPLAPGCTGCPAGS